jgi:CRISPR-associated protein Csh1
VLGAIREIGRLRIKQEELTPLQVLVEDPDSNGRYEKVITIMFEQGCSGNWTFKDVELENYEKTKVIRYLYKSGSASGADFTPTARLSGKPEGTFDRKILGWFNILNDKELPISSHEIDFLNHIKDELNSNALHIKQEILRIRDEIPNRIGIVVTLKFKQNTEEKYVGDYPVFVQLLFYQVDKKNEKCATTDKICSICGERKDMIIGNLDTYAFYTLDKIGFITGGFKGSEAWKNFPVCRECKFELDEGKKFLEKSMTFRMCGIEYNLIPKFIIGTEMVPQEILDVFVDTSKRISLNQEVIDRITADEDDILYYLKDTKDIITLNFLFIRKMNAAERIILLIEDVFPSRLRSIFNAKYSTDDTFEDKFTFASIRNFFSRSDPNKSDYDLDKYFLDIVDRVFKDRPISYHFLLKFIMKKIRNEFINDGYYYQAIKDGLMTIYFLQALGLIKMEGEVMEERIFDGLFKKYGPAFETPLKRGLFLLGVLTELLLRKQFVERSAKPFMKNLKSLKMNERDFKGLLPKIQNKLEEYNAFDKGKKIIAGEAANYLLLAQDDWQMSVDELNFYFSAGMNMVNEVAKIVYPDERPEEIENQE